MEVYQIKFSDKKTIENDDKFYFICSILAHLHSIAGPKNGHSTRVSIYGKDFDEVTNKGLFLLKNLNVVMFIYLRN